MIFLELFLGFLKVGLFSFGGAYAAIPLIRDVVLSYGWLTDEELSYMIAVSESTPGPIMVNLATYVGSNQAGFWGAALATATVVLPAFVIILLVMTVLGSALRNRGVQAVLGGLSAAVTGIVTVTGLWLVAQNLGLTAGRVDWRDLVLTAVLGAALFLAKPVTGKKMPPILLILIAGVLGLAVYSF